MLHEFACHLCAGAMLIFSVSFQFFSICAARENRVLNHSGWERIDLQNLKKNKIKLKTKSPTKVIDSGSINNGIQYHWCFLWIFKL